MELTQIKELLSMGGDSATIALVWFLWRLDRRLYSLEIFTGFHKVQNN